MGKDKVPGFYEEIAEHKIGKTGMKAIEETTKQAGELGKLIADKTQKCIKENIKDIRVTQAYLTVNCITWLLHPFPITLKKKILLLVDKRIEKRGR